MPVASFEHLRDAQATFLALALLLSCAPTAVAQTPIRVATTPSTNPTTFLQSVTFTANVVYGTSSPSNTGSVTFYDGATSLATIDFNSGQGSSRLFNSQTDSLSQPIHGGFAEQAAAMLQIPTSQQSQNNIGSASLPDMFSCNNAAGCTTSSLYPYQVGKYPLTYPLGIESNSITLLEHGYNDLSNIGNNQSPQQLDYFHGGYLAWLLMFGTPDAQKLTAAKNCVATGTWTAAPSIFPPGSLMSSAGGSTLTCAAPHATDAGIIAFKSTGSSATFTVSIANAGSTQTVFDSYTQSSIFNQTASYTTGWGGTSNLYAVGQPNLSGGATTVTYTCVQASAADPCVAVAPYFLSSANSLNDTPIVQSMLVSYDCGNGSCGVGDHTDASTNQVRAEQTMADNEMLANGVNVVYYDPNQPPNGYNPNLLEQTSQVAQYEVQAAGSGYSSGAMTFTGCTINPTATAALVAGVITPGTYYTTTGGACAGGTPAVQFTGGGAGASATAAAEADGTHPNSIGATSIATIAAAQLNATMAVTGANAFTVSYTTNLLSIGSHQITATVNPPAGFASSSASLTQIVDAPPATSTTLDVTPPSIAFGAPVTLTATVAYTASVAPSGTITFINGTTSLLTVPMTNGAASYTAPNLTGGPHFLTAVYSGDINNLASTSAIVAIQVNPATTSTTLAVSTLTSSYGVQIGATATVSNATTTPATGTVTFMNGAQVLDVANIAAGTASFSSSTLPAGVDSITASYSGNANFTATTSAPLSLIIAGAGTTTAFTLSNSNLTLNANVLSLTSGMPTGSVRFYEGQTLVGTGTLANGLASFTITALPAENLPVSAKYSGDTNFTQSASQPIPILSIIPAQTSLTVPVAGTISDSITLLAASGFSGTLQLSCVGLPQNATCSFQAASVNFPNATNSASTTLTIQTGVRTAALTQPQFPFQSNASRLNALAGFVWLPGLLATVLVRRRELHLRARARSRLTALLLTCLCTLVTACGGSLISLIPSATPAGSTNLQIFATNPTGVSQTAAVSLTVQ